MAKKDPRTVHVLYMSLIIQDRPDLPDQYVDLPHIAMPTTPSKVMTLYQIPSVYASILFFILPQAFLQILHVLLTKLLSS